MIETEWRNLKLGSSRRHPANAGFLPRMTMTGGQKKILTAYQDYFAALLLAMTAPVKL